jgi:uncharacterized surface protein with fasciclin (FAS1) repeats
MPFAVTAAVVGDENATMTPVDETGQMENQTADMTIAAYIEQDENLTRLAEAISVAGLYDTLNSGGPYTVFAPSDDAFNALGNDTVNQLVNDTDNLTTVLVYHVVEGEYTSVDLISMTENQTGNQTGNETGNETEGGILDIFSGLLGMGNETENMTTVTTLAGEDLNVTVSDGEVMIENATVTMADINTTNGVIHIIDQVLVPPGLNLTAAESQTAMETEVPTETPTETTAGNQTLVGVVQ